MLVIVKVSSIGQMEQFDHLLHLKPFNYGQRKQSILDKNTWNHLTVCKTISSISIKKRYQQIHSFKKHTYLIYIGKQDLSLNGIQGVDMP